MESLAELAVALAAEQAEVEKYWNAFRTEGRKIFRLEVVSFVKEGNSSTTYKVCPTKKAQYACHLGLGETAYDGKENRTFAEGSGALMVLFEYRSWQVESNIWFAEFNYTRGQLRRNRARVGQHLTLEHMKVLEREAKWNKRWRARRAMVVRALFWMLKGRIRDFRFVFVKELIETAWYAEAHDD